MDNLKCLKTLALGLAGSGIRQWRLLLSTKIGSVLSSRRCFEPGSILIFAKVKMGPGQEAYRGDSSFSRVDFLVGRDIISSGIKCGPNKEAHRCKS